MSEIVANNFLRELFPSGINVGLNQGLNEKKIGLEVLTPKTIFKNEIKKAIETIGYKKTFLNQGMLGAGEIFLGIAGYIGVTAFGIGAEAEALKVQQQIDPSVGQKMLLGYSASSVLIADGINLITGATKEQERTSITKKILMNLITDPMVDVGNGLLVVNEELERRKEYEGY